MTEAEWLASDDPKEMSGFLKGTASNRKLRLFLVACNGLTSRFGGYERNPEAIDVAERYADGLAQVDELRAVCKELDSSRDTEYTIPCLATSSEVSGWIGNAVDLTIWRATDSVDTADDEGEQSPIFRAMEEGERRSIVSLFRDIFGNPFRPVTRSPSWRTDTALSLAQGMYDARDFSAMPILADALQDAGCDNTDILAHCRGTGPHVRGCWVVDLVLGKA